MKKVSVILGSVYIFIIFLTLRQARKVKQNEEDTGELIATLEETLKLLGDKDKIHSVLCSLAQCPDGCDVCCNLPYNHNSKKMAVHHWLAQTGLWNEDSRFNNLPLSKASTVVYVGANNMGADGKRLMDMFNCTIHMFEPVPAFYAELSTHWAHYRADLGYDATTHNYGLGMDNRIVFRASEVLDGQGTFEMAENSKKKEIPLEIREGASVLRGLKTDKDDLIDLLHVNCEGCEWEMFDNLIESGELRTIRSVQFSSHLFQQVPNLVARYCNIKSHLSRNHHLVYGQSFGWERWDLIGQGQ